MTRQPTELLTTVNQYCCGYEFILTCDSIAYLLFHTGQLCTLCMQTLILLCKVSIKTNAMYKYFCYHH